ncbi:hypothetical protein E2C01_070241 [Portunus trituberculatus]|uniref:Uncharacterized protein n=1 Tax=Portunus trituberculatus TaxID=210409 RepID=A0A5B7I4W9_PORTR|nr:hypothetical protein [Portunus trituberculatus]
MKRQVSHTGNHNTKPRPSPTPPPPRRHNRPIQFSLTVFADRFRCSEGKTGMSR